MDIKEIIERKFDMAVHDLTVMGQGLDSIAYLVNNEYIFKQAKHDAARAGMQKEKLVLDYLRGKITLQIPEMEYYSEEYHLCGYKAIKGDKLTPGLYKAMSDGEKDRLAQDIAMFLSQMHALLLPDVGSLQADVMDDYNRVIGIIDFGDAAVTDRDRDFIYLLEESREELGRAFGMKVLEYYHHPDKDIPILKADLNEEYYPIELILGGQAVGSENMYHKGLNKIISLSQIVTS